MKVFIIVEGKKYMIDGIEEGTTVYRLREQLGLINNGFLFHKHGADGADVIDNMTITLSGRKTPKLEEAIKNNHI